MASEIKKLERERRKWRTIQLSSKRHRMKAFVPTLPKDHPFCSEKQLLDIVELHEINSNPRLYLESSDRKTGTVRAYSKSGLHSASPRGYLDAYDREAKGKLRTAAMHRFKEAGTTYLKDAVKYRKGKKKASRRKEPPPPSFGHRPSSASRHFDALSMRARRLPARRRVLPEKPSKIEGLHDEGEEGGLASPSKPPSMTADPSKEALRNLPKRLLTAAELESMLRGHITGSPLQGSASAPPGSTIGSSMSASTPLLDGASTSSFHPYAPNPAKPNPLGKTIGVHPEGKHVYTVTGRVPLEQPNTLKAGLSSTDYLAEDSGSDEEDGGSTDEDGPVMDRGYGIYGTKPIPGSNLSNSLGLPDKYVASGATTGLSRASNWGDLPEVRLPKYQTAVAGGRLIEGGLLGKEGRYTDAVYEARAAGEEYRAAREWRGRVSNPDMATADGRRLDMDPVHGSTASLAKKALKQPRAGGTRGKRIAQRKREGLQVWSL